MEASLLTESEIRQRIWIELQRATQDRHHEWRTPMLATVGADSLPQARTVVLRHADAKLCQLQIYTDSRSPKVKEVAAKPQALLVFWSKRLSWQRRVRPVTSVQHSGPEVTAVWARLSQAAAANDYLSAGARGPAAGIAGRFAAPKAGRGDPLIPRWQHGRRCCDTNGCQHVLAPIDG